jgi:hypothetical protein
MGWTSQVFTSIIIDESATTGGFFIYSGTPIAGNAPVLSITQAPTDPYGNTVTPSLSLSGLPLLVYAGPPSAGNLICSMAPAAGTDEFGNAYPEGFGLSVGLIPGGLIGAGSIPSTAVDFTATSIGGITTYTSASQPVGANAGSLWIDTSAGNAIYQYDGSAWSLYQFGSGSIAANTITATQIAANTITATQIAAGTITATQIQAGIVLAGAVNGTLIEGAEFIAYGTDGEVLVYSGTPALGNLLVSVSAETGTDAEGNPYPAGLAVIGLSGATNAISILDTTGDTLSTLDTMGNITGQTISANTDVILAGTSLTATLDGLSEGVISRGYIPYASLPYPSTAVGGTETPLFEQDFALTGGRFYEISLDNCEVTYSNGSGNTAAVTVRATIDGSTPTVTSDIFMRHKLGANVQFTETIPCVKRNYAPGSDVTMRCLATLALDTGSGTVQATDMTFGSTNFGGGQWQLSCYDMSESVPNTATLGSGGTPPTPPQTYTTTWHAQHTYCYQGSDGTNPNLLHDTDGQMLQGGSASATYNGHAKTWILFNYSAIASALSGATINWITVTLNNNHTWYSSGMTVALGWSADVTFGSSKGDPGINYDLEEWHQNSGATLTKTISTSIFGTAFQSGGATSLVLFVDSNNLGYYGYFAGGTAPYITINYTV